MPDTNVVAQPNAQPADATADMLANNGASVTPAQPDQSQQPQAQPQQPEQPSMWKRVLKGALQGLEENGIPGAVRGAVDPDLAAKIKQQRLQNNANAVQFKSAQAAAQVSDAAMKDQALHALPQELQDKHNESSADLVKTYSSQFGTPTFAIPNTGPHAMDQMKSVTAAQGGVDHTLFVNTGDMIYGWDTGSASQGPGALGFVKSAAKALGLAQFSSLSQDQFNKLPIQTRNDLMARANDVHGIVIPAVGKPTPENPDTKGLEGQLVRLQSEQRILEASAQSDPSLSGLLSRVKDNIGLVQDQITRQNAEYKSLQEAKTAQTVKGAEMRGKATQMWKSGAFIDEDNNIVTLPNYQGWDRGLAPANGTSAKALSASQQILDIKQGSQALRANVMKMKAPFSPAAVAQITAALHGVNPDAHFAEIQAAIKSGLGNQQLTNEQKDFLVTASQLYERALSLRSVAGIGQSGSDQVRQAIINALPQAGDTPDLMRKKLDAFDQLVNTLGHGILKVGRGGHNTNLAASESKPPQQQQEQQNAPQKTFSLSKWLKANPGGSAAEARAAATKANMKVIP